MRLYARHAGQPWFVTSRAGLLGEDVPGDEQQREDALDEALEETFPASDPIAPSHID